MITSSVWGMLSVKLFVLAVQDSKGVYAAREFVWWYNGHPDQQDLPIVLSKVESVAVCGIGNVALDCARVLLRPVEQLAPTDIAQHALEQLRHSKVRTVQLCARRGPVQVGHTHETWGRCA
jgi:adrenodoxin-NADP+ reductase